MRLITCALLLGLAMLMAPPAAAQKRLPVLRATRPVLSIREGQSLYQDAWGVSSATKPDIFVTQPFTGKKRLVFYADHDSLVFWVKPRQTYDFVVLATGQDSAYTRITTYRDQRPTLVPKMAYTKLRPGAAGPDTIAFTLDKNFGIHVRGKLNDSAPLDFLFDTGAGAVVITSALLNQKVHLQQDGQTMNAGADGRQSVLTSSGNTLEVAGLRWRNVNLVTINYVGFSFEGVLGWVAFENKVVELDYEHCYLVIHDKLPASAAAYSSTEMRLTSGIPYIKCTLTANGRPSDGWFDLDTGSDGGLVVGQQFAASRGLAAGLARLGTAQASGSTGGTIRQNIFTLPKLKIGDYELYQLPLFVNEQDPAGGASAENIGSNILKRFNLLLDFRAGRAYLKPNRYLYAPVQTEAK